MLMRDICYTLLAVVLGVLVLVHSKNYLVPLLLAILFWYLIRSLREGLGRLPLFKQLSFGMNNFISTVLLLAGFFVLMQLLMQSAMSLLETLQSYEGKVQSLNRELKQLIQWDFLAYYKRVAGDFHPSTFFRPVASTSLYLTNKSLMIFLYAMFILAEEKQLEKKMELFFEEKKNYHDFRMVIGQIDQVCSRYLTLKTIISFVTALVNYFVLWGLGVKFAFLWAFLIFTLNFIPNIGPIIATGFPVMAAALQFGSLWPGVWVMLTVGSVQFLSGNVLEPKIFGDSMNVSALVILITLVAWGAVWGIVGMFLSVPLTVMCIIVLSHFPATRQLAILLSADGTLQYGSKVKPKKPKKGKKGKKGKKPGESE